MGAESLVRIWPEGCPSPNTLGFLVLSIEFGKKAHETLSPMTLTLYNPKGKQCHLNSGLRVQGLDSGLRAV